jgi:hypothetical protein
VEREGTSQLRGRLCVILGERESSQDVARYSDSLLRRGFNVAAIDRCTMHDAEEAMDAAEFSKGHRQLFAAYAARNTPVGQRGWLQLLSALEKCAPAAACVQGFVVAAWSRKKGEEGEPEEEGATGED